MIVQRVLLIWRPSTEIHSACLIVQGYRHLSSIRVDQIGLGSLAYTLFEIGHDTIELLNFELHPLPEEQVVLLRDRPDFHHIGHCPARLITTSVQPNLELDLLQVHHEGPGQPVD